MGRPDVRMNYDTMEKMAKAFSTAQNQIKTTADAMKKIAQMMDGGALQGEGGNAFRGAIEGKLLPRMKKLEAKMAELSRSSGRSPSSSR
jgi:WXG100 family type VII secretion target